MSTSDEDFVQVPDNPDILLLAFASAITDSRHPQHISKISIAPPQLLRICSCPSRNSPSTKLVSLDTSASRLTQQLNGRHVKCGCVHSALRPADTSSQHQPQVGRPSTGKVGRNGWWRPRNAEERATASSFQRCVHKYRFLCPYLLEEVPHYEVPHYWCYMRGELQRKTPSSESATKELDDCRRRFGGPAAYPFVPSDHPLKTARLLTGTVISRT